MSSASMRKSRKSFAREHRERHQPSARAARGLLEKKKDYVQRARNYHSKQARLRTLAEKAALKNPDEYYTRMESARVRDGKYIEQAQEERSAKYTPQQLRAMKAQDEAYISYKHTVEQRRLNRMRDGLHLMLEGNEANPPKHTLFVEDDEERRTFDAALHFDTPAELLSRTFNRPRRSQMERSTFTTAVGPGEVAKQVVQRSLAYKELMQRTQREHALTEALSTLHVQRQLMTKAGGGARKRIVTEGERPVYRFKKERRK